MEKTQLALSPAESVTWYLMYVWPTFSTCGGYKPRRFNELLELSVGTGTCHVTVAFAFPTSVVTSMVGGHWMHGGWISVQGISDICINQFKKCRYDWFFLALFKPKEKENQKHIFFALASLFPPILLTIRLTPIKTEQRNRLQNSPYFCVFKYARAVKQKVWNEAEYRERDWGETLKIRFFFSRLTRPSRALRARKTLTPRFTDIFTDFEQKTDCFAV